MFVKYYNYYVNFFVRDCKDLNIIIRCLLKIQYINIEYGRCAYKSINHFYTNPIMLFYEITDVHNSFL